MALEASGSMSLGGATAGRSVNCELGCLGTDAICMDRADVRDLAGVASGAIAMSDFYGKSSGPPPGSELCGGYFAGVIDAGVGSYYIIVSPNATGCACCKWKTTRSATAGTCSFVDGRLNTYPALNNSTHPSGNWTATRTINGFSDWYLPAVDELVVMYGTKDSMPAEALFTTFDYWSSTECNIPEAYKVSMSIGGYFGGSKQIEFRATRAVRREPA